MSLLFGALIGLVVWRTAETVLSGPMRLAYYAHVKRSMLKAKVRAGTEGKYWLV